MQADGMASTTGIGTIAEWAIRTTQRLQFWVLPPINRWTRSPPVRGLSISIHRTQGNKDTHRTGPVGVTPVALPAIYWGV